MQYSLTYRETRGPNLPRLEQGAFRSFQLPSGEDWITFHRDGDAYVLQFPQLAQFRLAHEGRRVHCHALPDVPKATLRHLFWNQVLPFAVNPRQATVLHGGAVEAGEGAIAFLGTTGRGKSTLTAALAAAGHGFLADDALQVRVSASGQVLAAPGLPQLRLWDDSAAALGEGASKALDATQKSRFLAGERFAHCGRQRPLVAIYLLAEGSGAMPSFEPVRSAAALLELVQNAFLLDPDRPQFLLAQHETLCAVVRTVPVFRMHYARSYDSLADVGRRTVAHARSLAAIA